MHGGWIVRRYPRWSSQTTSSAAPSWPCTICAGTLLTAQNLYLMQANGFLDQTRSHLAEAEDLAAKSPRLIVLRKNTAEAIAKVEDYKKLSADLQAANNDLLSARMALDSSSSSFMEKALKFLDSQNQQMTAAVRAGAGSGGIERWMARVNGISGIILLQQQPECSSLQGTGAGRCVDTETSHRRLRCHRRQDESALSGHPCR